MATLAPRVAFVCLLACLAACGSPAVTKPTAPSSAEQKAATAAALLEQGRAFAGVGDSLRAQQYFASALKAGAEERVVLPLLMRACVDQKNYRLAVEYADAALARQPKNARLRLLSGTLYASMGDAARSRERLERAANELPNDAEVQFTVAASFRDDANDLLLADKYFRRYLALAPDGAHAEEAKSSLMVQLHSSSGDP